MKNLALYLHWPFCMTLCPYCDFSRGIWSNAPTQDPKIWLAAYENELSYWRQRLGPRTITSLFFGGGTPSLMPLPLLEGILKCICSLFEVSLSDIEVTLEMNPTEFEAEKLGSIVELGINRISVGVQSFQASVLTFLGRKHSVQDVKKVLSWLKEHNIRFSFDLIYAHIYHNDLKNWQKELKEALLWAGTHISLYQLTLEKGTPFYNASFKGKKLTVDSSCAADLYLWTHHYLENLGWKGYEISNYARSEEYCFHNLTYWRYQDYLGIGAGAHSRLTLDHSIKYAVSNEQNSAIWLEACTHKASAIKQSTPLTLEDCFKERLLMGLRLAEGIRLDLPISSKLSLKIQQLKDAEYVKEIDSFFRLTIEGRLRLDEILHFLLD
ncbi:radical S-adenosyl methionine domain-containing protein 1, mitochondrial [Holospora obtusa F1]|uniref:Heme chaperone HemW n=1 Tax=Holospora obtusa F1 TaxID=1399147 RepID=W6TEE9_HOLOB|nr:radical SAM family heme chaperone HemW [Holospora obtusa]ETZ07094.1 radical S-adenosyl methionine domain-containing protein 1, mitochondrial [Holospora obtusa F1]